MGSSQEREKKSVCFLASNTQNVSNICVIDSKPGQKHFKFEIRI